MGGYSSTPRKGKTSEEGGVEELSYAASGMQVSPEWHVQRVTAIFVLLLGRRGAHDEPKQCGFIFFSCLDY